MSSKESTLKTWKSFSLFISAQKEQIWVERGWRCAAPAVQGVPSALQKLWAFWPWFPSAHLHLLLLLLLLGWGQPSPLAPTSCCAETALSGCPSHHWGCSKPCRRKETSERPLIWLIPLVGSGMPCPLRFVLSPLGHPTCFPRAAASSTPSSPPCPATRVRTHHLQRPLITWWLITHHSVLVPAKIPHRLQPWGYIAELYHHHLNTPSPVRNPVFFQKASTGFSWKKTIGDISSPRTSTDLKKNKNKTQISEQLWLSKHLP